MNQLKIIPNAIGTLIAPVRKYDAAIQVDTDLYNALTVELEWRDWTYLLVGGVEVVKVVRAIEPSTLQVERAQEYTCRAEFIEAAVEYVETVESVLAMNTPVPLSISASGGLGTPSPDTIFYPAPTFTHLGNTESVGDVKVILSIKRVAVCCTDGQPPDIPLGLQPYRITSEEELRVIDTDEIRSVK